METTRVDGARKDIEASTLRHGPFVYMPPGTFNEEMFAPAFRFAAKISSAVLFDASAIYTYLRFRTSTGSSAVSFVT